MLVAFFIEEICGSVLENTRLGQCSRFVQGLAEWRAGSTLQLQRVAHQNLGLGTWKRTDETIPVTLGNDILGVYDASNPKHALLVKSRSVVHPNKASVDDSNDVADENSSVHSHTRTSYGNMTDVSLSNPVLTNSDATTANIVDMTLPELNFSDISLPIMNDFDPDRYHSQHAAPKRHPLEHNS